MVRFALAAALVAACATAPPDRPVEAKVPLGEPGYATAQPAPTLTYLRTERVAGTKYAQDVLLLRNDTNVTFQYVTDWPDVPFGTKHFWEDGVWREKPAWTTCGNGLRWKSVAPGQQVELLVESQPGIACFELSFGGSEFDDDDALGPKVIVISNVYTPLLPPESEASRPVVE